MNRAASPGPCDARAAATKPYVGLRPYTRDDKDLFFGRDRSAQLLRNKIYSSCLTVLYAPSGVGKTSLLQALVVPDLESLNSHVMYFDRWAGEAPARDLEVAVRRSVDLEASPRDLPPTLVVDASGDPDLVGAVKATADLTGKSVVLVLDQFEEYVVRHSGFDAELPRQLGRLIRSGADCYVVLSLREEFVAGLEVLRENLPNLFDSTFRLEHLTGPDAIKAIVEPAACFGVSYEDTLVTALSQDLRAERGPKAELSAVLLAGGIELPFLQIVCDCLWTESQRRSARQITRELYEELGRRDGILVRFRDDFARGLARRERWNSARVLRMLAPAGGLKMSFTQRELVENTALSEPEVDRVLTALQRNRMVRVREAASVASPPHGTSEPLPSAGETATSRYELYHDAFIRVWRPWVSQQLEDQRRWMRRSRRLKLASVTLGALVALVGWRAWESHQEYLNITERCFDDPQQDAGACLDAMTRHFLWIRDGTGRLDDLRVQLERRLDRQPYRYGLELSGLEYVTTVSENEAEEWPLVLRYSSARQLDPDRFTRDWQHFAKFIAEEWGIPVPRRVALVPELSLPPTLLRLEGPGFDTFEMELGTSEDKAYLSVDDLPGPAQEFLDHFSAEWSTHVVPGGHTYMLVPRWSLPVWKTAGKYAHDGTGLPAFALLANLLKTDPRPLLPPAVVDHLLSRAAKSYPVTVAEARAARGQRLGDDIAQLVRNGYPLKQHLIALLDFLASYPEPAAAPERLLSEIPDALQRTTISMPSGFNGPWSSKERQESSYASSSLPVAYDEVIGWLPEPPRPIRAIMGSEGIRRELIGDWDATRARIADDQDRFMATFGFQYPGVFFSWATATDAVFGTHGFRIEVLNQSDAHDDAGPILVEGGQGLDRFLTEMGWRVERDRIHWLTADEVWGLKQGFDKPLTEWLDRQYSLTDLKHLLRGVVSPDDAGPGQPRDEDPAQGTVIPRSNTIRHAEWLLRSLVFWTLVEEGSPQTLVRRLRETQRARLEWDPDRARLDIPHVSQGVRALEAGNFALARSRFAAAVAQDPDKAARAFLIEYPAPLRRATQVRLDEACRDLGAVTLRPGERLDLTDALDSSAQTSAAVRRRWELCHVASLTDDYMRSRRQARLLLWLDNDREFSRWPVDELDWTARELIRAVQTSRDPRVRTSLREVLLEFVRSRALGDLYWALLSECWEPGRKRSCITLAEEVAEQHSAGSMPLDLAGTLANLESEAEARRALEWLDRTQPFLKTAQTQEQSRYWQAIATLARANAHFNLGHLGEGGLLADALALYEGLARLPLTGDQDWVAIFAHSQISTIHLTRGDVTANRRAIDAARSRWPNKWEPLQDLFWFALDIGDTATAASTAEELVRRFAPPGKRMREEDRPVLFVAALAQLLTGRGRWEETGRRFLEETTHEYRPYVAMILYAFMGAREGQKLLEGRWAEFQEQTDLWPERLRAGDEMAWREMLIGYYLGHVERSRIFAPLESDDAFKASDLSGLYLSRRGLLCEAYFYDAMLAKARGDEEAMRGLLRKVLETDYRRYLEFRMARFLLGIHAGNPGS